jgi:hypothetical protein
MFLVAGISDSGYVAELQRKNFFLMHEMTKYKEEWFTSQSLGTSYDLRISKLINLSSRVKAGYEHHYKSEYYGTSYIVYSPEVGIRTNHDVLGIQLYLIPFKGFHKLSKEDDVPKEGLRTQPQIVLSFRFNLETNFIVPKTVLEKQPVKRKKK